MTAKKFHIGDVLSITTSRLVSLRHIDGVYDILGHLAGYDAFTHELPSLSRKYKKDLLAMFPELKEVDASNVTPDNWKEWLKEQEDKYGKYFYIETIGEGREKDPITTMEEALNGEKG